MTRKSSLYLIELCVMILVFAIASVFCIRMFGHARQESLDLAARDRALTEAQNAAELVKACGGDFDRAAALWGGHVDETGVWTLRW
ncbi:MAG: hypothetical protein E7458_06640, partial [Ruminococcaceae bacterium]|nr:hypothetical protein [Oscillospiraceae bacterium]